MTANDEPHAAPGQGRLTICIVGDELVAGTGDEQAFGWVGRLLTRTMTTPIPYFVPLPAPGENLAQLAERWQSEVERRRTPDADLRLVFALPRRDALLGTSAMRARLGLANCVDIAVRARIPTLVVGPPPLASLADRELAEINKVYADTADRRGVPYIDCFTPLLGDDRWREDIIKGGGDLPGQVGYGLMAWLILNGGWHSWLGLPTPPQP